MPTDRMNRRRILQAGGTALIAALAGCNDTGNDDQNNNDDQNDEQNNEPENQQRFTLPPVALFQGDGQPDDGTVTVRSTYEPATTPGDPNVYFQDEITFELFVYTTFPVGNSVTLTKVAEKTTAPYNTVNTKFEIPYEDLPKNQQMRFRLKVTNNNTGDEEWAMDQRLFYYEEYGDITTAVTSGSYTVIEGAEGWARNNFEEDLEEGKYVMNFSGAEEFAAPDLPEEVPFSREAYKLENDLYRDDGGNGEPICLPFYGDQIEMPNSHVEMTAQMKEDHDLRNFYSSFAFTGNVPSEYDYYGRGQYDVLENPLYEKMANAVNEAQSSYGVSNHFAKIKKAATMIQARPYEAVPNLNRAPVYLPEEYWSDPATNCVGHSFQLCWFLYQLGYTCGTVWLDRDGRGGTASHLGVGMPIPEEVMKSDFPDGYPEEFHDENVPSIQYIDQISDIVGPDSRPERLGEYPWVYIEATSVNPTGVIPFDSDTIQNRNLRFAIEPENNVFGTDIGAPNNR